MVICVPFEKVGITSVNYPVILLVNETFIEVPTLNLLPFKVKLPEVKDVDDMLSIIGLTSVSIKLNQQF